MQANASTTTPALASHADVINIGSERRKRSQRAARPVPSVEMAILMSLLTTLSPKKARKVREDLAGWHIARPDDASVLAAHKAAEALWGNR